MIVAVSDLIPIPKSDDARSARGNASKAEEEVLFKAPAIVVTDRRILFHTRSYAVSAVASVSVVDGAHEKRRRRIPRPATETLLGLTMLIFGAGLAGGAFYLAQESAIVLAILLTFSGISVVLGLIVLFSRRNPKASSAGKTYAVRIATVNGEKGRVSGLDRATAQKLAEAISAATAKR